VYLNRKHNSEITKYSSESNKTKTIGKNIFYIWKHGELTNSVAPEPEGSSQNSQQPANKSRITQQILKHDQHVTKITEDLDDTGKMTSETERGTMAYPEDGDSKVGNSYYVSIPLGNAHFKHHHLFSSIIILYSVHMLSAIYLNCFSVTTEMLLI
jgi:hypothetical protein